MKRLFFLMLITNIIFFNVYSMQGLFSTFMNTQKKVKLKNGTFVSAAYVRVIKYISNPNNSLEVEFAHTLLLSQLYKKCLRESYKMNPDIEDIARGYNLHPLENSDACNIVNAMFVTKMIDGKITFVIENPLDEQQS